MNNVLVTGGAGFIGSHVCDALLARNDAVICVDDFNDYYDPKIKKNNIANCLNNPKFKLSIIDIRAFGKLKEIFLKNKIDKIIHLAARTGVRASLKNPFLYEGTNLRGTINLLELAKEFKIKNFIFGSSSSVYGINKKIPFSETDSADSPISPYAATKESCELMCHTYHHIYGLKITCLRLFTVYGPRGRPDMAPYKFTRLINEGKEIERYGNGSSKRDYTYVSDIVDGVIKALDKELDFEIINLGNSDAIELNYFISLIEKSLGKKVKIKQIGAQPGDVPITYADISKAKSLLDWEPKVKIEEGIEKFVEWFGENKKQGAKLILKKGLAQ